MKRLYYGYMFGEAQVVSMAEGRQTSRDAAASATEDRLLACAGVLNRATAELVEIVAGALADGSWEGDGCTSPAHWLRLKAGLSSARARQVVASARRRPALPETMDLFDQGQLTLEQVSVVVAHVPAAYEASVAEMAPYATVDQLRRATEDYAFDPAASVGPADSVGGDANDSATNEPVPPVPSEPEEPATLSMSYLDRGRFQLRYEGPASEGALIESAIRETKDALWRHLDAAADAGKGAVPVPDAAATFAATGAGLTSGHSPAAAPQDDDVSRFAHIPAGHRWRRHHGAGVRRAGLAQPGADRLRLTP